MTPDPLPDEVMRSKWATWQQLQDNGLQSYTTAPEFNLSVGPRDDAKAFHDFCEPSGLVLDVGCGPQASPSYHGDESRVVGIDPLAGEQPRAFAFVQGVGEYLPFRNETFDQILYASSLDHLIDPKRSLADAKRCLKPDGRINLWIDGLGAVEAAVPLSVWSRYQTLIGKGIKSLSRHRWVSSIGMRRTLSYVVSVARMKVPAGASDYFHFVHLNVAAVLEWLNELNLEVVRQRDFPEADSVFIQAVNKNACLER
jgi:SAM-dependent methyltransferase